eukprot:5299828-Alexandrium_andersonii.AAC.1
MSLPGPFGAFPGPSEPSRAPMASQPFRVFRIAPEICEALRGALRSSPGLSGAPQGSPEPADVGDPLDA